MEDFAKTRRGQRFIDFDIPMIAEQLKRIADGLDTKNQIEEKRLVLEQKKYIREGRASRVIDPELDSSENQTT